MGAGTVAYIDLAGLRHNLQQVRLAAPQAKVMAIIKANAYGHGILPIAQALNHADALAVARVDEAIELREAGIDKNLIVLAGFCQMEELKSCLRWDIQPVIHHQYQIQMILGYLPAKHLNSWFKLDSGMHRLGFQLSDALDAYQQLADFLVEPLKLMSHLANADDLNDDKTDRQIAIFHAFLADTQLQRSCANSGGVLGWSDCHYDWVRPGIMLYGASPYGQKMGRLHNLKPVMTLKSQIIAINYLKKGQVLGYSGTWKCPQDTLVGVIASGYGDGYPRHAQAGTPVLIHGVTVPLIGRVSMDMIMVNMNALPQVEIGDEVILWGDGLPVEDIARCAETISYELFCQVTRRVRFVYSE